MVILPLIIWSRQQYYDVLFRLATWKVKGEILWPQRSTSKAIWRVIIVSLVRIEVFGGNIETVALVTIDGR